MDTLIIFGCGGHARSVASAIKSFWNIIFIDPAAKVNEKILGFNVFKSIYDIGYQEHFFYHVAIGDIQQRKKIFDSLKEKKLRLPVLCASSAVIRPESHIGDGSFIAEGAYIGPSAAIGQNCIINTHAVVEHDVMVKCNSHISVNAAVAGYSVIGASVMIGAGATVIDRISICDNVIVGAGAAVCSDILLAGTYLGVPAIRLCRSSKSPDRLRKDL